MGEYHIHHPLKIGYDFSIYFKKLFVLTELIVVLVVKMDTINTESPMRRMVSGLMGLLLYLLSSDSMAFVGHFARHVGS